jgi:prephenate dehydrogenase
MAGSEKGGIEFADADLFRGAAYALVPGEHAAAEVMTAMTELVKGIGATPLAVTAARHDEIAARVSHAPQLISTALALAISRTNDAGTLSFSGTGLAEMTRLAGSRWSVWEDICRTNADEISSALDEVIKEIDALRVAVAAGDFLSAGDMFSSAAEYARVLRESKG